jgi:hypothetical protein
MSEVSSWSPDDWWEWMAGMAAGPDGLVYAAAGAGLSTLDASGTAIAVVDEDDLVVPGSCWWCGGPDPVLDVAVWRGHLYVGALSGLHVFSLAEPSNPAEVGYLPASVAVADMAFFGDTLFLADGRWISAVDISDPAAPTERARIDAGAFVRALGVNARDRRLMALTPTKLVRFQMGSRPWQLARTGQIGTLGLLFHELRVEGRWTYLSGLWTQTVYDDPHTGLSRKGSHDVRPWVDGAVLEQARAVRVDWTDNAVELWRAP